MSQPLLLRHATSRDARKVADFYESNSHPNLKARGEEEMLAAAKVDRRLVMVLDGDEIVAAAAVFDHIDGSYFESGAARVILNGYNLQKLLLWARTVHTFLMDPPGKEFFSVVRENGGVDAQRSQASLVKSGFEVWNSVPDEARALKPEGRIFFRLPREALVTHAKHLLAAEQNALTHRETGQVLKLDLGLESLSYHRDAVESLASGSLECLGEHI